MGGGAAARRLAGAVSEAGGLGVVGASWLSDEAMGAEVELARGGQSKPIGVNLLLFGNEQLVEPVLELEPAVFSTAWPRDDQDLGATFARAHERGAMVMHMVATLPDAVAAVEAGADVIVAQGTEGGGHVGEIGTTVLVRQVAKVVARSARARGGRLRGRSGLAAALALGAGGILLGTRFMATEEFAGSAFEKAAVVASDGHDTIVTSVLDTFSGRDWPGAWSRAARSRFVEEWLGREPELRRRREGVLDACERRRNRVTRLRRGGSASRRGSWTRSSPRRRSFAAPSPKPRRSCARIPGLRSAIPSLQWTPRRGVEQPGSSPGS